MPAPPTPLETDDRSPAMLARRLYAGVPGGLLQRWRPAICPFDMVMSQVPTGSRVLDVGCGSGLFLGLLAGSGRLGSGVGFDSSAAAIARAEAMRRRLQEPTCLVFEQRHAAGDWPGGRFDVVAMIDMMHHVPPHEQRAVLQAAARRLRPGGVLVYKDMALRPAWRSWMNRLHDLVLARQWIHYAPIDTVAWWMRASGLEVVHQDRRTMLWYGHELLVGRAGEATAGGR